MKNKARATRIISFSLMSLIAGLSLTLFTSQTRQDIRTRAQLDPVCTNNCQPNGGSCNFTSPGDSCCQEVEKTGDPLACPWPQRGYCSDAECSTIPEGVSRQRCGGPRHSWCNVCRDAKCPGYDSSPTLQPSQSINPTEAPQPTVFEQPTTTPEIPPTSPPVNVTPTNPPQQPQPQVVSPTKIPQSITVPQFTLPQFTFPSFQIHLNGQQINEEAAKPLGFFEFLFERIVYYDTLLEQSVNNRVNQVFKK